MPGKSRTNIEMECSKGHMDVGQKSEPFKIWFNTQAFVIFLTLSGGNLGNFVRQICRTHVGEYSKPFKQVFIVISNVSGSVKESQLKNLPCTIIRTTGLSTPQCDFFGKEYHLRKFFGKLAKSVEALKQ